MTVSEAPTTRRPSDAPGTDTRRPLIVWFAVFGAVCIAFDLYLLARWYVAGNMTPNRIGASEAPAYMTVAVWAHTILGAIAFIAAVWWFVLRPRRRDGQVPGDGLLMLAAMTAFWGDLAANYWHLWVMYPTVWPNIGAWYNFIPGWGPAGGERIPEATIFFLPMYSCAYWGAATLGVLALRGARRRNPGISNLKLFLLAWLTMGVFDFALEIFWIRLGILYYPSTIGWLTLFKGHYYQFPIYESILWGLGWGTMAALRFFRNDRGEMLAERGASRLHLSPRALTGVRFLAFAGAANAIIVVFNIVIGLVSTQADPWPKDVTSRPYMQAGLCPDVPYACPQE